MAHSQFGSKIERLAAEYAHAKKAVEESSSIWRDGEKLMYYADNGSPPEVVKRYLGAERSLQEAGITVGSLLLYCEPVRIFPFTQKDTVRVMHSTLPYFEAKAKLSNICSEYKLERQPRYEFSVTYHYRPFSIEENMLACIGYKREHQDHRLRPTSLSSLCAFIGGPEGRFKIEKISFRLVKRISTVDYEFIKCDENCKEFDIKKDIAGKPLLPKDMIDHPLWSFLVPKNTLQTYYKSCTDRSAGGLYYWMRLFIPRTWKMGEVRAAEMNLRSGSLFISDMNSAVDFAVVVPRDMGQIKFDVPIEELGGEE